MYGKFGVDFFSTSEFLYPNMKFMLPVIRARPNFYLISDSSNVSHEIFDCSLFTRRIPLKDVDQKKAMGMLRFTPVDFSYRETLAKTFIVPAGRNQFNKENFFNKAPVRRIGLCIQIQHSLHRTKKIPSGINNLISDKLEGSEEVSQL